jgi:uncharacterized membrane protein
VGRTRKPVAGRARDVVLFLDRCTLWLSVHWLGLFNTLAGLYVGLPVMAPVLDWLGLSGLAEMIYSVYSYLCHQLPQRSFFVVGHQVAICQRDVSIYGSIFIAGLAYAVTGRRWRPLPWWGLALTILPTLTDGSVQLFGSYESTWYVRVLTGALVGVGTVWFLYPRFERVFVGVNRQVTKQIQRAVLRDQGLL